MIRELIYDYKDWQSIEATGRSGSDDGFDVRAYEKTMNSYIDTDEQDTNEEVILPMNGNLWMIQCKREQTIGPQKIADIIIDCIDGKTKPYGYILVAPTNFSKKSFDKFREELAKRGIYEFYLWGKAALEDMLHMPRYDRILFTFFGISLLTKKRNRSTEIRSVVTTKNKFYRLFGEDFSYKHILIRDANDTNYPYEDSYSDFENTPKWKKFRLKHYAVLGIWITLNEYYAYYDKNKKEWDYTKCLDLNIIYEEDETEEERIEKMNKNKLVREYWECLPKSKQSTVTICGLLKFSNMIVIDEKGDELFKMPHIYSEYNKIIGPFEQIIHVLNGNNEDHIVEREQITKINLFPEEIKPLGVGKYYKDRNVAIDRASFEAMQKYHEINAFFDANGKYGYLKQLDIIKLVCEEKADEARLIKITQKYSTSIKEYLKESDNNYFVGQLISKQLGADLTDETVLNVYEFVNTYLNDN